MHSMLLKIRTWLRRFLGINELASSVSIKAVDVLARQRHSETLTQIRHLTSAVDALALTSARTDQVTAILNALVELNKRLTIAQVDHPAQFTPPELDWDTVQAVASRALDNANMPNELKEIYGHAKV